MKQDEENCCDENGEYAHGSASGFHHVRKMFGRERAERALLRNALVTLALLLLAEVVAYYGFFRGVPGFWKKYGYYNILLAVMTVVNAAAVWHVRAYRKDVPHMAGMMIGMTIGMVSGFTLGALVGATNGMFVGAVYGMAVGIAAGAWCGKCCGVMGVMEGLMAGLMGGTMGPMLSVMMLNDNVRIFLPILLGSVLFIVVGLMYMLYKESSGMADSFKKLELLPFLAVCFLVTVATMLLIVYGPKSLIVGG